MRLRGVLVAFSAMLLLAGMFVAVHRGARGREVVEQISELTDLRAAADVRRSELRQEIEFLRSRARIVHAAQQLGMHVPSEDELIILELTPAGSQAVGGSR